MEIRGSNLKMIAAVNGSWDVAAAYMGMSVNSLRNRAYEVKGQTLTTEHSLSLQRLSGTTHFAEAIAIASGGTFVKLPDVITDGNEDVHRKFHELYEELGTYSHHFMAATSDNEIDPTERADLTQIADAMHKTISELQALIFRVYCKGGK